MRLHRLTLEGFGPFRERQEVDFDAFADDGMFLIAGRTGAGKSSVLDGVCFALYGGVPRYDGGDRRLRSDHCGPDDVTRVAVEFTTGGRRWRVTRSPEYERAKRRGSGTTLVAPEAQLDELVDGEWRGRASGARNVGLELDDVLGLSQQQFLQVILLAQNRFAQFLLAKNDERQKLLRRLFGTRTYEDYQTALDDRRREAERLLAAGGDGIRMLVDEIERRLDAAGLGAAPPAETVPARGGDAGAGDAAPGLTGRVAQAGLGVQRARYQAETLGRARDDADAAHRRAEAAHQSATAQHERQLQRLRSREELAALDARAADVDDDRRTLERARRAEALRSPLSAAERAEAALGEARMRSAAARDRFTAADDAGLPAPPTPPGADPTVAELRESVGQLAGRIALWSAAAERERALEAAQDQLEKGRLTVRELEASLDGIVAAMADVPARIAALDAAHAAALIPAHALDERRAVLAEVDARLTAATQAAALAADARAADATYLAASEAHDGARRTVTALLRRRLAGYAGELAQGLTDGEPCAVCGSTDHPAPAVADGDAVTDDEIARAEAARDARASDEKAAADAARVAQDAAAAAAARAGGEGVGQLTTRRGEAAGAVAAAEQAVREVDRLEAERTELRALSETAAAEKERIAGEVASLREQLAGAEARLAADVSAVAEARGDFARVADRLRAAETRKSAAESFADALVAAETAAAVADEARRERDERVSASDFADLDDAVGALREPADRESIDARIREYDAALRAERDRLRELELELAGIPDEPVDVTLTQQALADARTAWSRAVDAAAQAAQTADAVAELAIRAEDGLDALAGLAEDHEIIARLANTVAGRAPNTHRMTLESFVLAAELEEIVAAANVRLTQMSDGRYLLHHTDALAARGAASGLGLEILDAHTGAARPAQSLSGGETFLASLALALGLAEVVTARAGGIRLDTLFIDEGFGSLDDETLDLAMRTLDELRSGGRTVGLISHVAAMKEQIPAHLVVEATAQGPSVIRQDAPAGAQTP